MFFIRKATHGRHAEGIITQKYEEKSIMLQSNPGNLHVQAVVTLLKDKPPYFKEAVRQSNDAGRRPFALTDPPFRCPHGTVPRIFWRGVTLCIDSSIDRESC